MPIFIFLTNFHFYAGNIHKKRNFYKQKTRQKYQNAPSFAEKQLYFSKWTAS